MAQEVDHQTVTAEGGGFGSTESQTLFFILTSKHLLGHLSAGYEQQNEWHKCLSIFLPVSGLI